MKTLYILAFLLTLSPFSSQGKERVTGLVILDHLEGSEIEKTMMETYLNGLGTGIMIGGIFLDEVNEDTPQRWCFPDETTPPQLNRVLLKYLEENPQELHRSAAILMIESLAFQYACARQTP